MLPKKYLPPVWLAVVLLALCGSVLHVEAKPDASEALRILKAGNARFASGSARNPHSDVARINLAGKESQGNHAYATILSCSDSRVPPERIFDAGVMDVFVVRVAGNVAATDEIGTIEYGLAHVKTPVLVVMGHSQCGAVTAVTHAIHGTGHELERNIPSLVAPIFPAVKRAMQEKPNLKGDAIVPHATEMNVWQGIENVFMASPAVRRLYNEGTVKIVGVLYDVGTGNVRWLPEDRVREIYSTVMSSSGKATDEFAGGGHGSSSVSSHGASSGHSESAASSSSHSARSAHAASSEHAESNSNGSQVLTIVLFLTGIIALCFIVMKAAPKLKMRLKLASSFGVVLAILVALSVMSYLNFAKLGDELEMIAVDDLPIMTNMADIETKMLEQTLAMAKFGASGDKALAEEFNELSKIVEEELAAVEKNIIDAASRAASKEEKVVFEKLEEEIATIEREYIQFEETGRDLIKAETSHNSQRVAELESLLEREEEEMIAQCSTLVAELKNGAIESAHAGHENAKSAELLLIILSIVALIVGLAFALLIANAIANPLVKSVDMMKEMSKGHLGTRLGMTGADEIGEIASAMDEFSDDLQKNVVATVIKIGEGDLSTDLKPKDDKDEITPAIINTTVAIRNLIAEAGMLSKAAVEGKLATRGAADKYKGGYREIVSGVNNCLDAVINPLNVTAKYVDDISKGVIPPIITDNYNGDFNIIKNNLNTVVKMMSDLLKETDVIIKAAADGELDKRANAALFQGGWNQLVSGVNDTITNIVNPLMVTADYVDKVSNGVIPPEITTVYKGQYNIIKNNLNSVVKMMSNLLKETDTLVKAALGGALNTRAKAELFVGGWNELVAGINKTLDAILEPINEAAGVLEKVAARDLTARVKGDYKGDHAKIKAALNSAVDNIDTALTQVAEATEQVSSGSQQISAGSQNLAQGANEQASSLEEVSSSLEEMSSMTKQNAENANQAKNLAGEANSNAAAGTNAMTRMSSSINKIKDSSDQTAKIVKTIDEIAMQTNLLALNAAVEAARAGEAGRGFAVVAEEVRNLAQRSAEAAKNTANMIEESVKNAEEGVKISSDVAKSFDSIVGSVQKVNDLIAEIAAASQEQSQGIDQVNNAVAQMDKVTQQNAANSEESASAAEEMSSQAEELQSMVAQFRLSQVVQQSGVRKMAAIEAPKSIQQPKNGNGRKHLKATEFAMANKKAHAEQPIPMDDEVLKRF